MSITLPRNIARGTDDFNRFESQLARERSRRQARPMPVAEKKLLQVLVVDDKRDTTDVLARLVSRWGHEAHKAYDGVTALSAAAHQAPDVVLLDIAMPHMDGFQVAEHLRGDARLQDCFLIAMTGCAEMANRLRCREAGIDLFLIKPVESSVLETLLNLECTRLGRSRRERGSVTPKISAVEQWAADPWDVVPDCNPKTTVVL